MSIDGKILPPGATSIERADADMIIVLPEGMKLNLQLPITVIRPGALVELCGGKVKAVISHVCVFADLSLRYEIVFWVDGLRRSEWVQPHEVVACDPSYCMQLGFAGRVG